jgi:hypothetical protein
MLVYEKIKKKPLTEVVVDGEPFEQETLKSKQEQISLECTNTAISRDVG